MVDEQHDAVNPPVDEDPEVHEIFRNLGIDPARVFAAQTPQTVPSAPNLPRMQDVLRLASTGQINVTKPITRRYALEQADEAYQALNRGEIVGRAIVVMD